MIINQKNTVVVPSTLTYLLHLAIKGAQPNLPSREDRVNVLKNDQFVDDHLASLGMKGLYTSLDVGSIFLKAPSLRPFLSHDATLKILPHFGY